MRKLPVLALAALLAVSLCWSSPKSPKEQIKKPAEAAKTSPESPKDIFLKNTDCFTAQPECLMACAETGGKEYDACVAACDSTFAQCAKALMKENGREVIGFSVFYWPEDATPKTNALHLPATFNAPSAGDATLTVLMGGLGQEDKTYSPRGVRVYINGDLPISTHHGLPVDAYEREIHNILKGENEISVTFRGQPYTYAVVMLSRPVK